MIASGMATGARAVTGGAAAGGAAFPLLAAAAAEGSAARVCEAASLVLLADVLNRSNSPRSRD
jgi:hypothetical protein